MAILVAGIACDTTAPGNAISIVRTSNAPLHATVAQPLTEGLQIQIKDARGNLNHGLPLAGVPFTVTVASGGGTISGTPTETTNGSTSLGVWTLGTRTGPNTLTVRSGDGAVLTIVATATAGPPVYAVPIGQTSATSHSNVLAPLTPTIRVSDTYGNGVPGVAVPTALGPSSGTVTKLNPVTDSAGVASVGSWMLGDSPGPQTVTMAVQGLPPVVFTVTAIEPFNVDVRFVGTPPSAAIQAAFLTAAARIQQTVTDGLPGVPLTGFSSASACFSSGFPVLNETIDDVLILAQVTPIDGVGGVLGQSGPCGTRLSNGLPYLGIVQFDSADVAALVSDSTFGSVVLHEFQHVLGFGTIWIGSPPTPTLLSGTAGTNPIFTGATARAQYLSSSGTSAAGVPVEAGGGEGTALSHWRETVFRNELMTGFLTGLTQPYSRISIGSLADIGYAVAYGTADAYVVPAPGQIRANFSAADLMDDKEILIHPRTGFDGFGRPWAPWAAPAVDTVSITVRKPSRGQ